MRETYLSPVSLSSERVPAGVRRLHHGKPTRPWSRIWACSQSLRWSDEQKGWIFSINSDLDLVSAIMTPTPSSDFPWGTFFLIYSIMPNLNTVYYPLSLSLHLVSPPSSYNDIYYLMSLSIHLSVLPYLKLSCFHITRYISFKISELAHYRVHQLNLFIYL